MRHDVEMIDFLETARETGEWMERDRHGPPPPAGGPMAGDHEEVRP
jgi:hypothetical protein